MPKFIWQNKYEILNLQPQKRNDGNIKVVSIRMIQ